MALDTGVSPKGKLVIRNVGLLLSGDIHQPIRDADTVVAVDGLITAVGKEKDCDTSQPDTLIDAKGTCLCPGLIDSHMHPVFGDWTPRQNQLGWIDSTLNGGVTTMISAGECTWPALDIGPALATPRSAPSTISVPAG
jgi:enamidase